MALLAIGLVVVQLGVNAVFGGLASLAAFETYLGVVLTGLFSLVVVAGLLWHRRNGLPADRYPRLAGWVVGSGVGVLALNLVMIAAWSTGSFIQDAAWAIQAAAMGTAAGMIFGSIEARAIERALLAERARVRADEAEAQREWLEYLNGLLRHEVLNTANVVVGYSDLLLQNHDGDEQDHEQIERIARQSRRMTEVIQDVRLLIEAAKEEESFDPVDVVDVVEGEAAGIADRYDDVVVETALPDRALVAADDLLSRVFSNLLDNAVEHDDGDLTHVRVAVEAAPDLVTVRVEDDGPGVPEHERETLFERGSGDHGLGLYLVRTLVERYGGSIALEETGPEGTTFRVELPTVDVDPTAISGAGVVTAGAT